MPFWICCMTFICVVLLLFPRRLLRELAIKQRLIRLQTISVSSLHSATNSASRPDAPLVKQLLTRINFFLQRMAVLLHPSISPTTRQKIQRQLINAGLEDVYTVEGMYGLKSLTAAGCLAYFVLLGIKAGSLFIGMGILAASFGYWLPNLWLRQKINRRKRQIRREFPYILSTLAVMSEAGLQLFPALQGTVGTGKGEVVQELRRVVKDASFGMALAESLQRMAHRCQVEEVNRFVSAVTQNLERGTGIAQVLRKQSVELWNTRKKKAQQLGQQASLKMFFPLLLLVFPAIIIFILGPVLIQAAKFLMQP